MPLRKVSTFGVGFFFILSGYGLALSHETKDNYLKGFLIRKLPYIAVTAIISRIISEICLFLICGTPLSAVAILKDMNWYIYVLLILYLLFYVTYKFVHGRLFRVLGIWGLVILITFVFLVLTKNGVPLIGRSFFISEWAFPFGITIYEYRDKLDTLMKKHGPVLFVLMVILMGLTFVISIKAPTYTALDLVSHNLMLVPFYYFVFVICNYFTFDNKLLQFLKSISYEIYLYQFAFLIIVKNYIKPLNVMYFIITVLLTTALAAVIYIIQKKVMEIISTKKS